MNTPTPQPQRSEQQEWQDRFDLMRDEFLRIAACPNVTNEIKGICERAEKDIRRHVSLIDELATERKRRERVEFNRDEYKLANLEMANALLSALAAIEKVIKIRWGTQWVSGDEVIDILRNVDLSLLHEHDAEVRKPLVELLVKCRRHLGNTVFLKHEIDDALANVKP